MKGHTNNPKGRPPGARNKISVGVKRRIIEYVEKDFDKYIQALETLEPRDMVRSFTELLKLVIPRPVSDEELDAIKGSRSTLLSRLFERSSKHSDDPDDFDPLL
jgi:hypothetical protein